jgi:hypothetical protein
LPIPQRRDPLSKQQLWAWCGDAQRLLPEVTANPD